MKQLRELNAMYGSNDIGSLVDFASQAPINLPEDRKYFFEKEEETVHIYSAEGIDTYELGDFAGCLKGMSMSSNGPTFNVEIGDIKTVVLHFAPWSGLEKKVITIKTKNDNVYESMYGSTRTTMNYGGESRSGGSLGGSESRSGESRCSSYSSCSGESRGGESRGW